DPLQRIEHPAHGTLAQRGVAVEGRGDRAAGDSAEHETAPGSRIAEIKLVRRRGKAADADAANPPLAGAASFDLSAKRLDRFRSVEHVLAFEQAADTGLADRKRPEDQRAMRNRLVTKDAHAALEGAGTGGGERGRIGVHGQNSSALSITRRRRAS